MPGVHRGCWVKEVGEESPSEPASDILLRLGTAASPPPHINQVILIIHALNKHQHTDVVIGILMTGSGCGLKENGCFSFSAVEHVLVCVCSYVCVCLCACVCAYAYECIII